MTWAKNIAIAVGTTLATVALLEMALQLYVTHVECKGRLFRADPNTGWGNLPNIKVTRLNAAGEKWVVENGPEGFRKIAEPIYPRRTILILGDSFAFGEGVNIDDRFDSSVARAMPDARIINTGTMGFGTDQEYVIAKPYLSALKEGDTVIVLFYQNDFFDVLRRRFALRSRPYFERQGDRFLLKLPGSTWRDWLRDQSYIASLVGRLLEPPASSHWNFAEASSIIGEVLKLLRQQMQAGVILVIAHHGRNSELALPKELSGANFCGLADVCIDIDPVLVSAADDFLPDGHWSAKGHAAVGRLLAQKLAN